MNWLPANKFTPAAVRMADRHYSRRTPGAPQFAPPGQTVILLTDDAKALWGSHRPAPWVPEARRFDGFEGHSCFIFRNEGYPHARSSDLIREAVGLTAREWGDAPFITYVAVDKVASANPGYCFLMAGFHRVRRNMKSSLGPMDRFEMDIEEVRRCRESLTFSKTLL